MLANLNDVLRPAQREHYAVGLFNTVDTDMLEAVIGAAEEKSGFNCFFGERIFPPPTKNRITEAVNEAK